MAKITISESKSLNKSSVSQMILYLYNLFNNYLVVAYDAKSHVKVFNQGIQSLENRKLLINMGYSTKHASQSCDEDNERSHCSLLDWSKSIKLQRQYLDENGAIPNDNGVMHTALEDFFVLNPHQRKAYDEALKNYLNE